MSPFFAVLVAGLVRPNAIGVRPSPTTSTIATRAGATVFASQLLPSIALAAEIAQDNEIDYGSVSAPNFILPLGAGLAILTALLPVLLKSGDDAARQMQERDAGSFGKEFADSVSKKPKK